MGGSSSGTASWSQTSPRPGGSWRRPGITCSSSGTRPRRIDALPAPRGPAGTLRAVERESQLPRHFGDVGERLREERKRQGVSQRELAARLGLSPSLISQIETGRSKPSVSTLYAIVTELRLSLDRLFRGPEEEIGPEDDGSDASRRASGMSHGAVVRPEDRHVIELESGVRWERLTGDPDDEVDFLYVVYDVGGASAVNSTLMRHSG